MLLCDKFLPRIWPEKIEKLFYLVGVEPKSENWRFTMD